MKKILSVLLLWLPVMLQAQEQRALQAWKDQKYSMFIHWGAIYSTLGGVWKDKPVTRGYSEQIQSHGGIHSDLYAAVAKQFHPDRWNADSIVLLAKAAGMRSVVMTSKHHDGFCMFKTATTDYNVVDATPFKRDVLKELSDACARHGLRFGLYFSLIDWHYPQAYPISSHNSDPITPEHHAYNQQQVTELLSNYGPVSEIWFDMGSLTAQQSRDLANLVHRLQPGCMVSGRLGNDAGDFCVMGDNEYPDYQISSPWQTPASVYDETWGYRSWQKHGASEKKAAEKLEGLIKVVSRGGNYLLNIGPRGDGSVVEFEKEVLLQIGEWLKHNGEAIYGASPNPFDTTFAWGEVTTKPGKLYLHLLRMPEQGRIILPGLTGNISSVTLLSGGRTLRCRITDRGDAKEMILPADFRTGETVSVLALAFKKELHITPLHLLQHPEELNRGNAVKQYSFSGVDYESYYRSQVGESWTFTTATPAKLGLVYSAAEKGKTAAVTLNGRTTEVPLNGTEVPLNNHPEQLQWGPMYVSGHFYSGLGGAHGDLKKIDPQQPWPRAGDKPWTQMTAAGNGVQEMASDRNRAWYVLQEITAPQAVNYLAGFTSGDGIQVFLNGVEQIVHNNPERGDTRREVLLLPLQAGKNQLVVKFYNRFATKTSWGIHRDEAQVMYTQPLQVISGDARHPQQLSIRQAHPVSVHRNMSMPNLSVTISH